MKTLANRTLSLFLLFTIVFSVVSLGNAAPAAAASTDFTITNGVLTKYNGSKNRVTIPSTVKSIGERAFEECTDIIEISIPKSVTSIGRYAFEQCSGLTKITIPDSVTTIGNYAFDQCTGLKSVTISNNVKAIGIGTFNECDSLTKITIPDSVTTIGKQAFNGCTSLKSATISSVKTIGLEAFEDCDELTISGYKNTAIQTYADKNRINFKSIGLGTFTLDTKTYTMTPRSSYTIGAKLVGGNGLTVKAYSSKNTVAKVTRVSSKEYKVTSLKVGTANIMFDIYDKNNKKLAHTYVKITVKRGINPSGSASKQVVKF